MRIEQKLKALLLTSSVWMLVTTPAWSQMVKAQGVHSSSSNQRLPVLSKPQHLAPTKEIRRVSHIEHPSKSARMLVQSPTPANPPSVPPSQGGKQGGEIVQVTAVKANPTKKGLEIILQTPKGQQLQITNRSAGNSFIADILNAQLSLPSGDAFTFRSEKPISGITEIIVINIDANTIRVTVIGEAGVPTVELFDSPSEGLIFGVASAAPSTPEQQQSQTQPTGEPTVPETQTQPSQPSAQGDEPIELVVTGEQDGYRVPDATTATRTDTPIRDIPASIQVIPREVIRDQGATSIREAVRNVSGVTLSSTFGGRPENFIVRGFTAERFLNGFREDSLSTRTQTDLANIERIEVLKGPASVLFGRAEPSGIINFVTKQPLLAPYYNVSFTAGSYNFYRPALDFSGPLTDDKSLAYRLNLAYENAGSFRDFVDTERFFLAPTLTWQISPDTKLSTEVSYLRDARPIDRGLVVLRNNRIADIPISRLLGNAVDQEFAETRAALYFDHRFNPNLSLRSAFRYTDSTEKRPDGQVQISGQSRDDRNFPIRDYFGTQLYETYTFQNDLIAKFNTGSVKHTVLLGLELARQFSSFSSNSRSPGFIDIFNPNYDFTLGAFDRPSRGRTQITSFGIYLQDQIALLENLKLILGGRFDTYLDESNSNGAPTETEAQAFSPRVGIVYQPIPEISLYSSYTRSFTPVTGRSVSGTTFDPRRGTGYEVGVKTELLNGRLFSTLAFYDTTLSNVLSDDIDNPGFFIQVGEQRSRGIEFDLAGEILPGWKIIASYGYTDAVITKDSKLPVDNRLNNVPRHTASLWTTYTLQNGGLKGLGFGGGVFYIGDRAGDLANTFEVPSYTRLDAAVYYETGNFRTALNFKNLSNIRYFEGSQSRTEVQPGAPFTVQGTISWQF